MGVDISLIYLLLTLRWTNKLSFAMTFCSDFFAVAFCSDFFCSDFLQWLFAVTFLQWLFAVAFSSGF
jgi:L-asparagine transporter-like permease